MQRRRLGSFASPVLGALAGFLRTEASGGVVLLLAAGAALVWANSEARGSYELLWHTPLAVVLDDRTLVSLDLRHWINDLLMALFFFVVGLEIKREIAVGELSDRRKAAVPVVAALGGMILPAAIYVLLNLGGAGIRGWGIPMATDIAFAVGVLALFGSRVPHGLKILLLSLAIADDIGAIVVIGVFYSADIQLLAIGVAAALLAGVYVLWRVPAFWSDTPLVMLMFGVWLATFASGIHATIAGVALGLAAPTGGSPSAAVRLEKTLHPWTSYVVVPLFALANAGVYMDPGALSDLLTSPISLGVAGGLVFGKIAGITFATFLAVRSGLGRLPAGVTWPAIVAVSAVAGIGFTVSLFIAALAFEDALLAQAKIGILSGSLVAALLGVLLLWRTLPAPTPAAGPRDIGRTGQP